MPLVWCAIRPRSRVGPQGSGGPTVRRLAEQRQPATPSVRARKIQADVSWWHPWRGNQQESRVPRQALFTKVPEAPRYFAALAAADTAAALPATPVLRVRPVAPYDDLAPAGPSGT